MYAFWGQKQAVLCGVKLIAEGVWCDVGQPYVEAQGYVPVLLENLRGMSCSGISWPLGGPWFQCRYGGV